MNSPQLTRRAAMAAGSMALASLSHGGESKPRKAHIAITFDLEMSRNFPAWEDTHWDYEKGNLNEATKRYTLEAAARVKASGGVLHSFVVGRVLEQENIDWLKELATAGHPIGNHTYDHVYLLASDTKDLQFRFQRAPWLIEGRSTAEVIRHNIHMTTVALKERAGIEAAGFRTPGGFANGLDGRPDLHELLQNLGFGWVSGKYPVHPAAKMGEEPTAQFYDALVAAQQAAQPYAYPNGLVEVPMSPISDIGAFRTGRWKLAWFLKAIRRCVAWAIEHQATFDFLAHPSCLYVVDPQCEAVQMICQMVQDAGDRAEIVDVGTLARRAME